MSTNIPAQLPIYVGEPIRTLFASVSAEDFGSRSWRISNAVERYQAIVEHDMPTLTVGQWCAILNTLNGTFLEPLMIQHMWMEIEDHEPGFLEQKWGIDGKVLIERLKAMPLGSLMAIAEVVQQFWSSGNFRTNETYEEVLTRLGAKVSHEDELDVDDLEAWFSSVEP